MSSDTPNSRVPTQFSGFETLATLLPAEKLLIKLENAYDLRKSGLYDVARGR